MKSRTNQPIFKDDGTLFDDAQLVNDIQANGGTKLYRHKIDFDSGANMYIVNNVSTPYTYNSLVELINEGLMVTVSNYYSSSAYNSGVMLQASADEYRITIYYVDYEEGVTTETLDANDFISDTVTEL